MQIQSYKQSNPNFGVKYKLSKKTIAAVEKSTGLTHKELTTLHFEEARKLMIERGTLKEPSKLKQWCAQKYREIGEKLGLLEKRRNIYTDVC